LRIRYAQQHIDLFCGNQGLRSVDKVDGAKSLSALPINQKIPQHPSLQNSGPATELSRYYGAQSEQAAATARPQEVRDGPILAVVTVVQIEVFSKTPVSIAFKESDHFFSVDPWVTFFQHGFLSVACCRKNASLKCHTHAVSKLADSTLMMTERYLVRHVCRSLMSASVVPVSDAGISAGCFRSCYIH
jgi:hypothetical protein